MLVAQNYNSVTSMLVDATLDFDDGEETWDSTRNSMLLNFVLPLTMFWSPCTRLANMLLYLALEYTKMSGESLPFHAWGHMTAIPLLFLYQTGLYYGKGLI